MSRASQPAPLDLLSTPLQGGTTLIEASAGTGKTYCLTGLVLRLLLERTVDSIGQILVVTFTQAATEELVGRIRSSLREAQAAFAGRAPAADPFLAGLVQHHGSTVEDASRAAETLRDAMLDFDDMLVSTLHGFCKRVLDESAFESGLDFEAELLESDEALRLDAARDAWRRLLASDPGGWVAQLAAARNLRPEAFAAEARDVGRHPGTVVLPEPLSVRAAAEQLAAAKGRLASVWQPARVRMFLSRRRWQSRAPLADVEAQRRALAEVDALCAGHGGFDGALVLASERLAEQLRDPADELSAEPAFAVLQEVWVAAWQLEHAVRCQMLSDVAETLQRAKDRAGLLAFDDLLHRLDRALQDPEYGPRLRRAVRSSLRVALVDEFQDTDRVQYRIFRDLFRDGPLFLVGDPKQAIYRFRGADVFAYLSAKGAADRIYTLDRNWRSAGDLVRAVNALFAVERPFIYPGIPHASVRSAESVADRRLKSEVAGAGSGRPLQLHWLGEEGSAQRAEARLVAWTAREVVALLSAGLRLVDGRNGEGERLRPAEVAVLVRTNDQAQAVQEGLRRVGVPAVVSRSGDIFHTEELEELERVLRAVLDPADRGRLRAACATLLWGMDAGDLHRLSDAEETTGEDAEAAERWQRLYDAFDGLRATWREDGFVAMARRWLDQGGVRERLLGWQRGERRLTNVLHGIEVLARALHDERLSPAGLVDWLATERRRAVHERDATELRLESDDEAVEIATVHKAKGLEYEVVLCPFLWQARPVTEPPVTVYAEGDRWVREAGSWQKDSRRVERHLALAEAERLAEDLRLLYVAVTRARRRCLVAWGAIGRGSASAASALAYLLHRRQGQLDVGLDAADWTRAAVKQTRERVDQWPADLARWAADHADLVEIRSIEDDGGAVGGWQPGEESPVELGARVVPEAVSRQLVPWQIASFSSLSRPAGRASAAESGRGGRELPDRTDPPLLTPPWSSPDTGRPPSPARGIFAFARGPRAGQCLHDILERLDFPLVLSAAGRRQVEQQVQQQLLRFGLAAAAAHRSEDAEAPAALEPAAVVVDMLRRLVRVDLPDGPRLASVERAARLSEWQFWAPLRRVSAAELAGCFRDYGSADWAPAYAERLESLSPRQVEGYLTGYVDLVFESGGRIFVVDWKSNHLGNTRADYDRAAMIRAMEEHHYFLQYHLYVVALARYLRSRGDRRPYDDAFGSVYYVFLRGLGAAQAGRRPGQLGLWGGAQVDDEETDSADTGVFHDRPSRTLIEALDALLFGPSTLAPSLEAAAP